MFIKFVIFVFYTLEVFADNGTLLSLDGHEHECYRECKHGENKVCVYNFIVSTYSTMSTDCGNCPFNQSDCENPLCVTASGKQRIITTANYKIPGPAVLVCLNDTIIVNLRNKLETDSTSIHFHGEHQHGTPWMDGVPFVTQCPVLPGEIFQYKFIARTGGTHMWHGHTGFHESDGLFGQFVVRTPEDFNNLEYDYDLAEHTMILWHWSDRPLGEICALQDFSGAALSPYDIIINGKSGKEVYTKDGKNYTTPLAVFEVTKGNRYRFRVMKNSHLYCPVQISIDNHNLTMIASDSGEFNPIEVESFIVNAGERYDFVLNANAPIGTYWIRVRGVGSACSSAKIHQQAILKYQESTEVLRKGLVTYDEADRSGKLLNPVSLALTSYTENDVILVSELESSKPTRNISGTPDTTIYFELKLNSFKSQRSSYVQINHLTFSNPKSPPVSQWNDTNIGCDSKLKHYNCIDELCTCPYTESIKKGDLVEFVLVALDLFPIGDHPFHLHGNSFQVVAMKTVGENISVENIRRENLAGQIPKKLDRVPYKDTISVPSQGFVILRFVANNPGYWFFHCHITVHATKGMAVIIKVGENGEDIPAAPQDIPKCGDFPSFSQYY